MFGKPRCFRPLLAVTLLAAATAVAADPASDGLPPEVESADDPYVHDHMAEALRAEVGKVVVIGRRAPAGQALSGSYAKETAGLMGGMASGSRLGRISKQIGGVPINIPIPILTIPGAIFGGLTGAVKREIQDFRDALTEELAQAGNEPLSDDGLALDVFWGLRKLPDLDSKLFAPTTPIPEDTDAILFVSFHDIAIDVQGREAIITTAAEAALRRISDDAELYRTVIRYQDRDSLRNWTDNDNALWRDYANYARHFLGREISAELFDQVELTQNWTIGETASADSNRKDPLLLETESMTPELAWELVLPGGDAYAAWTAQVDEASTYYDIEIYDAHQLVYFAEQIAEPRHIVGYPLEPCRSYRWSVRPSFHVDGKVRYGEWMRFAPPADPEEEEPASKAKDEVRLSLVGRQASLAPAFTQDFAKLATDCR